MPRLPSQTELQPDACPFEAALNWLQAQGVAPARVLWLMPRIESAVEFKRAYARHQGLLACLSPKVQTADRLSQPRAVLPWLNLQTELVGLLAGQPSLTGGLVGEGLWALAQEYLELAMRLVLVKASQPRAWASYLESSPFAAQEAAVVTQLATTFEHDLLDLLPKPSTPGSALDCVVWYDDGEALPAMWLNIHYPGVPVLRVALPAVQGPKPWQQVAEAVQAGRKQVRLCLAPDETTQAQQAAWQIVQWLQQNPHEDIAVAVLDRLAARRLVPVLASLGVRVDDRTGWRLSTASVAGWLDQVFQQHAEQGEVVQFTHPFTGEPLLQTSPWAKTGSHTLAQWAQAWRQVLNNRGLDLVLESDEAGRIVLLGLAEMAQTHAGLLMDAHGFLAAWRYWAEQERFRPEDVQSPVRMVPLQSTRLRQFKRALVLGCAQAHLKESPPGLLPPSVAHELGFTGPNVQRVQKLSALHHVLMTTPEVALVHASTALGRAEPLLPELQWLDVLLEHAGLEWKANWPPQTLPICPQPIEELALRALPKGQSVPARLRVTGLDDWAACPLRFGLKHALPWPNQNEQGALGFYQLRGIYVHKVLERTARHMQSRPGADLQTWKQALQTQSQAVRQGMALEEQAVLHPFVAPFEQFIPRIAGRLMAKAIEGWQFDGAERSVAGHLDLPALGRRIELQGRLDRLDRRGHEVQITDIKFKSLGELRKLAQNPLKSPQLPAYQALLNLPHAQLCFLGVHSNGVEWVDFPTVESDNAPPGVSSWGEALWQQLQTDLQAFFDGSQTWQARPGDACAHCDVRGVCRPSEEEPGDASEVEGDA
ncbi:PD-(D/E)XK nuclease family protein [Limnobacter sp.]|uniref:PD-(D/E)XK nuclease family protein n=1 Tax=Limnobacter sp. TaxID=2003368 RepID=UPI003518746E